MTRNEIAALVDSVGVPAVYHQFTKETAQAAPFICFYTEEVSGFIADGIVYVRIEALIIELYTKEKDFALEDKLEGILTAADMAYHKDEDYIGDEELYMTTYTMEVFIDA
jgi:hypothetical protein